MDQISIALDCIVLSCLILKIAISLLNLNFIKKSIKSSLGLGQDSNCFSNAFMSFLCVFVQRILLSIDKYESQISLLKVLQGQTSSQDLFSVKGPGTFSWLPCSLHSAPTNGKCEHQRIGSNVSLLMICYQKMVELYSYFIYLCSGGKGHIKISWSKSDS